MTPPEPNVTEKKRMFLKADVLERKNNNVKHVLSMSESEFVMRSQ